MKTRLSSLAVGLFIVMALFISFAPCAAAQSPSDLEESDDATPYPHEYLFPDFEEPPEVAPYQNPNPMNPADCKGEFIEDGEICIYWEPEDAEDQAENAARMAWDLENREARLAEESAAGGSGAQTDTFECECDWYGDDYFCAGPGELVWDPYQSTCPPSTITRDLVIVHDCVVVNKGCSFSVGRDIYIYDVPAAPFFDHYLSALHSYADDYDGEGEILVEDDVVINTQNDIQTMYTALTVNDIIYAFPGSAVVFGKDSVVDVYTRIQMDAAEGLYVQEATLGFSNPAYNNSRIYAYNAADTEISIVDSTVYCIGEDALCDNWAITQSGGELTILGSTFTQFESMVYHGGDGNVTIGDAENPNTFSNYYIAGIYLYNDDEFDVASINNNLFLLDFPTGWPNPPSEVNYAIVATLCNEVREGREIIIENNETSSDIVKPIRSRFFQGISANLNSTPLRIQDNLITDFAYYGITVQNTAREEGYDIISDNGILGSLDETESVGIYLDNDSSAILDTNLIWNVDGSGSSGLLINLSNDVTITGDPQSSTEFRDCWRAIRIVNSNNIGISDLLIRRHSLPFLTFGIYIESSEATASTNIDIGNSVIQALASIYARTGGTVSIHGNYLYSNTDELPSLEVGIYAFTEPTGLMPYLCSSSQLSIVGNYIGDDPLTPGPDYNYNGIQIQSCQAEKSIKWNNINNSDIAINIYDPANDEDSNYEIYGNTVTDSRRGIHVIYDSNDEPESISALCNSLEIASGDGIRFLLENGSLDPTFFEVGAPSLANKMEVDVENYAHLYLNTDDCQATEDWWVIYNWYSDLDENYGQDPVTDGCSDPIRSSDPGPPEQHPYYGQWSEGSGSPQELCEWP
ncbi:MAG: hypothetical protein C4523_11740 [Myxococcales bacterium]|nr:MAG: hypothetical protein C4523_11740 [Myxococcales bacterium]